MTVPGNLRRHETSPYLLQHADNPVHWRPWRAAALAEAAARDRPILLSIGYAACHWCHVMAHESFDDPGTAALMNDLYVCIKVDREERPDIDHLSMSALQALGERGGWPLTMFLTPQGDPFWGGTYFPPEPRRGRRSFRQVLCGVAGAYCGEAEAVRRNAGALRQSLAQLAADHPGDLPGPEWLDSVATALLGATDPVSGGLRGGPKFPNLPNFRFLWQNACRTGAPEGLRRCTWRRAAWHRAAFMTISAADSPAMRRIPRGWCRISGRCFTTMPRYSTCWHSPMPPRPTRSTDPTLRRLLAGCCAT